MMGELSRDGMAFIPKTADCDEPMIDGKQRARGAFAKILTTSRQRFINPASELLSRTMLRLSYEDGSFC